MSGVGYVYFNKDTAEIKGITFDPDAALASLYAFIEVPRSELDLLASSTVMRPKQGFVYYEPVSGQIRGVSFTRDADLDSRFDAIAISIGEAEKFMEGEYLPDDWCVGRTEASGTEPVLVRRSAGKIVLKLTCIDEGWVMIPESPADPLEPVGIIISIARRAGTIRLILRKPAMYGTVESDAETVSVIISKPDDPSVVYAILNVSLSDLFTRGTVEADLGCVLPERVTVLTRRITPATTLEVGDYHNNRLPLPSHFCDLVRFGADTQHASLAATIRRDKIVVKLNPTDIGLYERDLAVLPLLLTKPGDPTFILHAATINVSQLFASAECVIALPPHLRGERFDLYTRLLFASAGVKDTRRSKASSRGGA